MGPPFLSWGNRGVRHGHLLLLHTTIACRNSLPRDALDYADLLQCSCASASRVSNTAHVIDQTRMLRKLLPHPTISVVIR